MIFKICTYIQQDLGVTWPKFRENRSKI